MRACGSTSWHACLSMHAFDYAPRNPPPLLPGLLVIYVLRPQAAAQEAAQGRDLEQVEAQHVFGLQQGRKWGEGN